MSPLSGQAGKVMAAAGLGATGEGAAPAAAPETPASPSRPAIPRLSLISAGAVAALYLPTFYKLFSFGWDNADYSHGPLVLGAFLWLVWQKRGALLDALRGTHPHPYPPLEGEGANGGEGKVQVEGDAQVPPLSRGRTGGGWVLTAASLLLLLFGLACYAIGASHGSMAIESFSMVPVLIGAAGYLFGRDFLKAFLFPACFLLFLVPPPLVLTDLLTAPLKMLVATSSAAILRATGYLVTRNGATILMSDYSITVGDPCSGMRSLIALMSVGALYAQQLQSSPLKKATLFCSTFPISVMANIVRLMMLCLITFYWGEAAAEGFLHKFSGFVLFVVSLVSLFLLDILLHKRRAK